MIDFEKLVVCSAVARVRVPCAVWNEHVMPSEYRVFVVAVGVDAAARLQHASYLVDGFGKTVGWPIGSKCGQRTKFQTLRERSSASLFTPSEYWGRAHVMALKQQPPPSNCVNRIRGYDSTIRVILHVYAGEKANLEHYFVHSAFLNHERPLVHLHERNTKFRSA